MNRNILRGFALIVLLCGGLLLGAVLAHGDVKPPHCTPGNPCTTTTGTTTTTTTTTVPTTTGTTTTIFRADFNGTAGTLNTNYWTAEPGNTYCSGSVQSCPSDSNVFMDGAGHLVLQVKRDANSLNGSGYSGAFVGTFDYGSGWPPTGVKVQFPVPFRIEMLAKMPPSGSFWYALWPMNTDKTKDQCVTESDVTEYVTAYPDSAASHQHLWCTSGETSSLGDCYISVPDIQTNWNLYWAEETSTGTTYGVNNTVCGHGAGVSGQFGILIDNVLPWPPFWGSSMQPLATDPGPWQMLIDYIQVSGL